MNKEDKKEDVQNKAHNNSHILHTKRQTIIIVVFYRALALVVALFFVNCVSDLMAENNLQNTTFTNYNKALHSGNSFESFSTGKLAFPANYCSNMTSLKGSIRSFTFTSDIKASGRVKWPKMLHKTASCSQFTSLISLAKKV